MIVSPLPIEPASAQAQAGTGIIASAGVGRTQRCWPVTATSCAHSNRSVLTVAAEYSTSTVTLGRPSSSLGGVTLRFVEAPSGFAASEPDHISTRIH